MAQEKPSAPSKEKYLAVLVTVFLYAWQAFLFLHPIFLTPSDIGRHIKNGDVIVHTALKALGGILHTNYYSLTEAAFPFVNHHWGSGVVFYSIFRLGGFTLLSLFALILSLATLSLALDIGRRYASWFTTATVALFLIPLITLRFEVRPELFSYFFSALFFWILLGWRDGRLSRRVLVALPLLELVWINLHIYFILGFLIIGAFGLEVLLQKNKDATKIKTLLVVAGLSLVASLANPSTWRGLLFPLGIFNNYGLAVSENQSVAAVSAHNDPLNLIHSGLLTYKISALVLCIILVLAIRKKRPIPLALAFFSAFLGLWAYTGVRNLSLFAIFAIPLGAIMLKSLGRPGQAPLSTGKKTVLLAAVFCLTLIVNATSLPLIFKTCGIGLMPGVTDAANFINQNAIPGPLFNDFDSGGFVIFSLFPRLRPFVDNRPEAYPADLFTKVYVPLHTDQAVWQETLQKYNFNVIYYSFDDTATYAMPFIVARLTDPAWAPVFADQFGIVLVRRTSANQALIQKYEIPPERFSLEKK